MSRLTQLPSWLVIAVLAAIVVAVYSVSIAACGPWDPWETHYGEVARQILVRHDPLDLWWQPGTGPDGRAETTFWSKPALPFWLMAASMKLFGVGTGAAADEMVQPLWPELALRLPSLLTGLLTAAFAGFVVWRLRSPCDASGHLVRPTPAHARTAGITTALVLSTMPQWAIVTRQALTDMFFVAPVVVAFGAWALATLGPDRDLHRRPLTRDTDGPARGLLGRLRALTIPWDRAYLGFICTFIVVAAIPIAVMHHHVLAEVTRIRVSQFPQRPGVPNLFTLWQVGMTMWFYWGVSALCLLLSLRFRRRSQAWMGIMYLAAGVSAMGKGLIGPGLIGLLVLGHMFVSGRLRLIRHSMLGLGTLLFVVTSFPWHHAMIVYRGWNFFAELIVVNNLARFASGEQEQAVGSFGFYVRTLGLAGLPWAALLPAAIWGNLRRAFVRDNAEAKPTPTQELRRLALLWFVLSFGILTYSITKYYHYLLPCLPPVAILIGLWLADRVHDRHEQGEDRRTRWVCTGFGLIVLALILRDATVQPAWLAHLTTYLYTGMWNKGAPEVTSLLWCGLLFGLGLLLWSLRRARVAVVTMLISGLLTTGYVLMDYLPAVSEEWSQRSAVRTYYQLRGPDEPLLSWWFYYRGETLFTKADVWVLKEQNRAELNEYVQQQLNDGKVNNLWVLTTGAHARRLKSVLPRELREGVSEVYANHHYKLMRVPLD